MRGTYRIITYGCQMNVHESEKLAGILRAHGYEQTDDVYADVTVLNTCCIRETAETHVLGNLGALKKLKEKKNSMIIAVCGCMTQAKGSAEKLKERCGFINVIFGTHNLEKFGEYLDYVNNSNKKIIEVWDSERAINEDVPIYRTSGVNAWVNITYGCNNFCSYCIVPYVRGRERSRSMSRILQDIDTLLDDGYKEITLLGQNVNSYGNDLNDGSSFAKLLNEIARIPKKFRLKFMTSHPKDLSESVVTALASSKNFTRFIHLPAQSGSDKILKLMNRKYTANDYLQKIEMIRKLMPDAVFSGDIMVGFPYETDEDFLDTIKLVEKVRYQNLFTFIYSIRKGTPAAEMEQVSLDIKKQRIKVLIDKQFEIANELAEQSLGKTFEVLCHEFDGKRLICKTICDKTVYVKNSQNLVGEFFNVKITSRKNSKLYGEIIK